MFPKYDKKQFANVVTEDETLVHYFEPVRKVSNKIWATKHSKGPIIAKCSLSTKKVLYAIFFSGEGVAVKVPVKKGKSITGKYYKDIVLKKLKKYYQKRRPATGFKHVRLLHDNAPAHISAIVTAFLKKEKVTVLPPPVFPRPCPMWFLFVSEIESIPCWVEIPVPRGTWICHSSVPYYCAQISIPWRLQEVDTSAETLHF